MTPVKPQLSRLKAEKSCQVGFTILYTALSSRAFVSESSRSYMLAYRMSVEIALGLF
jgi:hypothetical protein